MRVVVRSTVLLLAIDLVCLPGPAVGQDYGLTGGEDEDASGWRGRLDAGASPTNRAWNIEYRVRRMMRSSTSYQFGTSPGDPAGPYAPLSRLDFGLDSTWHGLQLGLEKPDWRLHFEWLTPIGDSVDGVMADFDWNIRAPRDDPSRLDSLTHSSLRWRDGQILDLGGEFKWTDRLGGLPLELWPMAGFRFQRFHMMASGLTLLVPPTGPVPEYDGVDVLAFNQQYYVGYFGGQLRTTWWVGQTPVDIRFQADGGPTAAYNVDHHLLREGKRFTMENTRGGAWHLALVAEAPLRQRLCVGLQADHMAISTTGSHRLLNVPLDQDLTWSNGVLVTSYQTSLTGYLRVRF